MAKKTKSFDLLDEDEELTSPPSRDDNMTKMPMDTTGSAKKLIGFQEIPVAMLHPFTLKNGSDFSRHNKVLSAQFVESIKDIGIVDVLVVRASPKEMGMYEIIAGESRWEHAKEAGLTTVPCRIMNLSNEQALSVFNVTNLLRRDLTPRDRINGWYAYYMSVKARGTAIDDLDHVVEEEQKGIMTLVGGKGLNLRSIQRYVKMHNLIQDWLVRLDNEEVTLRVGYQIAFLPDEVQYKLLPYKLNENTVNWLRNVYEGKDPEISWNDNLISDNFDLNLLKEWCTRLAPSVANNPDEESDAQLSNGNPNQQIMLQLAKLPKLLQKELLAYQVDASMLSWLYDIYVGNTKDVEWSSHVISDNFEPLSEIQETSTDEPNQERVKLTKEERARIKEEKARIKQEKAYGKTFKAVTPKLIDTARAHIRPADYERADEIIEQALKLYYEQIES